MEYWIPTFTREHESDYCLKLKAKDQGALFDEMVVRTATHNKAYTWLKLVSH